MNKSIFTTIILLLLSCNLSFAQDVITKRDGTKVPVKILEVSETSIKYIRYDNLNGPTYTVPKNEVYFVSYENGSNEIITEPKVEVHSGMKFKEYSKLYNAKDYQYQKGDALKYNPVLDGICSGLLPGLGQIIAGETWRGIAFLAGAFAIGGGAVALETANQKAGIAVAYIGITTLWVFNICDAVKVAKIKSMYSQDLQRLHSYNIDLNISPSFAFVPIGNGVAPTLGLSLRASF